MIEHELDENNDIVLRNGSFATVVDARQVAQHVRTRLLLYLGEWFLDSRAGTPWFQEVFVKPVNLSSVESIIKQRILNTPELARIIEFALDFPDPTTRLLQVRFTAETEFGGFVFTEELSL